MYKIISAFSSCKFHVSPLSPMCATSSIAQRRRRARKRLEGVSFFTSLYTPALISCCRLQHTTIAPER